jgi:hypothetical protein
LGQPDPTGSDRPEPLSFQPSTICGASSANDESEKAEKRTQAVIEIFRKYVYKEMTLEELSDVLKGAKWIDKSGLDHHSIGAGWVPVDINWKTASLWDIEILAFAGGGRTYLWFSLEGFPTSGILKDALKGKFSQDAVKKMKITDCAAQKENGEVLFHIPGKKK